MELRKIQAMRNSEARANSARAKGFIKGKNRDGERRKFPITSVSLAIVDCRGEIDLNRLARRAAEMKKYAKSKPGNVYVRDRRSFPEKPAA